MAVQQRIRDRLTALITEGAALYHGDGEYGYLRDEEHRSECVGWLVAASHVISLICTNSSDPYRTAVQEINSQRGNIFEHHAVGQTSRILERIVADVDAGLIVSVQDAARAETLDDLLEQAEEYQRRQQKQGSSILATAVFEDTVRRIARTKNIEEAGLKLDVIITALDQAGVISKVTAKECRAAAGVRNHALHAQWDEFTPEQVRVVIELSRRLLREHLGG